MITRTHYESRMVDAVRIGGIRVGTVETVTTKTPQGTRVRVRGTCHECCCELDAQGDVVDAYDHSDARYHVSADAAAEAIGKHALKCDEMIVEMARYSRSVAA